MFYLILVAVFRLIRTETGFGIRIRLVPFRSPAASLPPLLLSLFLVFVFLAKDRRIGPVHLSQDHFVKPDRFFTSCHGIARHHLLVLVLLNDGA